jgi:hypothetical protein
MEHGFVHKTPLYIVGVLIGHGNQSWPRLMYFCGSHPKLAKGGRIAWLFFMSNVARMALDG